MVGRVLVNALLVEAALAEEDQLGCPSEGIEAMTPIARLVSFASGRSATPSSLHLTPLLPVERSYAFGCQIMQAAMFFLLCLGVRIARRGIKGLRPNLGEVPDPKTVPVKPFVL